MWLVHEPSYKRCTLVHCNASRCISVYSYPHYLEIRPYFKKSRWKTFGDEVFKTNVLNCLNMELTLQVHDSLNIFSKNKWFSIWDDKTRINFLLCPLSWKHHKWGGGGGGSLCEDRSSGVFFAETAINLQWKLQIPELLIHGKYIQRFHPNNAHAKSPM